MNKKFASPGERHSANVEATPDAISGAERRVEAGRLAFTITEFCAAYRISRSTLYALWTAGGGPAYFKIGKRTLIAVTAADAWRRELEVAAQSFNETKTRSNAQGGAQ